MPQRERWCANEAPVTTKDSAEIAVLSTLALRGVLVEIAEEFRARTGHTVAATYKSTNAWLALIAQGAKGDMVILTREAIDALQRDGKIVPGSAADLARSGIGIAVPAGAPKPDIGTVEAFTRAILAAKSIAFSRQGASGVYFAELIGRLGIADQIRAKAKIADTYVGEMAARGEAEIAVQQISELKPVAGIDIVGPLPAELQKISIFAAGILRGAQNAEAAAMLIAYLAAPSIAPVLHAKGLELPSA
jgi:molybdate transport system substrate-binding protein